MAADHFAALVDRYRDGRTDRQITSAAEIPHHWLSYYLKPSTSIKTMPEAQRISALARAIGCSIREVHTKFSLDVTGTPFDDTDDEIGANGDPQTKEMQRLWSGLDPHHRVTGIAMLRSLNTLQRRTTIETSGIREVG